MQLYEVVMVRVSGRTAVPAIVLARNHRGTIESVPLLGQLLTQRQLDVLLDSGGSCLVQSAGQNYCLSPIVRANGAYDYSVRIIT